MAVFISHSSRDDAAVQQLAQHLQAARENVWMDQSLIGGEDWWSRILTQIRSCDVFLVALSNNFLQSKPCRAELNYAKALGLPILPVLVGDVESYRIDPIFTVQSIDYRNPDVTSGMALITALHERATERTELPNPLPEPPAIPYEYLQRLGVAIDSPDDLKPNEQTTIIADLRRALRDEDDDTVREDIRRLLRALRRRSEVTYANVSEIDALLQSDSGAATPPPAAPVTPVSAPVAAPAVPEQRPRGSKNAAIAAAIAAVAVIGVVGFVLFGRNSDKPATSTTSSAAASAAPTTSAAASATTVAAAPANPTAGMIGKWSGTAKTVDGNTFPISLDITQACTVDQLCGTIAVPQVPCYGQVFLQGIDNGEVEFRVANFDQRSDKNSCQPGAGEHFKLLPDGKLSYRTTYDPIAQGELQKQ